MTLHTNAFGKTSAQASATQPHPTERSTRGMRWAWIVYVAMALLTPLVVYSGPDVMTPTAPMIADAALDGHLSLRGNGAAHEAAAPVRR